MEKIGTGIDSVVFLDKQFGLVYKKYQNKKHTKSFLNWYAELTQLIAKRGTKYFPDVEIEGKTYKVTCRIVPHFRNKRSNQRSLIAAYIPGPSLLNAFNSNKTSEISKIYDIDERIRLAKFFEVIRNNFEDYTIFRRIYTNNIMKYIDSCIEDILPDNYTVSGEMNIKLRMPDEDTLEFVVTDIFANVLRHYNKQKRSKELNSSEQ